MRGPSARRCLEPTVKWVRRLDPKRSHNGAGTAAPVRRLTLFFVLTEVRLELWLRLMRGVNLPPEVRRTADVEIGCAATCAA